MLFVGDDWAGDHHDAEIQDETGRKLTARRLPEGAAGIAALHELIAGHLGQNGDPGQVVVAIETGRGLWVQALAAAGYQVYGLNPEQVARFKERCNLSGAKSDAADAHALADLVRTERHQLRAVAADTPEAEAIKVVAASTVTVFDTHDGTRWPPADTMTPPRERERERGSQQPRRLNRKLQASGACGAGQRGRFHRRPGNGRAARPGRSRCPPVPAGRAAGVRAVRAQAGISLVQRQARLPVPPRPHQRHRSRPRPAREHLRPRGPDPAASGRDQHPARRFCRDAGPRQLRCHAGDRPGRYGPADRPDARRWSRTDLRPRRPDPARRQPGRAAGDHRQ